MNYVQATEWANSMSTVHPILYVVQQPRGTFFVSDVPPSARQGHLVVTVRRLPNECANATYHDPRPL